jgi:hypothetical protein
VRLPFQADKSIGKTGVEEWVRTADGHQAVMEQPRVITSAKLHPAEEEEEDQIDTWNIKINEAQA